MVVLPAYLISDAFVLDSKSLVELFESMSLPSEPVLRITDLPKRSALRSYNPEE